MRISNLIQKITTEEPTLHTVNEQPVFLWNVDDLEDEPIIDSVKLEKSGILSKITPQGTDDAEVLAQAPKPDITIAGVKKKAGIVVDITTNVLYRYDSNGNPKKAYQIASGVNGCTERGVRIVTHKEKYPYRTAPKASKRRRNPRDYGPFIICVNKIDTTTGEQSPTGEFIHGCRSYHATFETNPKRYVSHGCMRMDNNVITQLSAEVSAGEIVIIK